MVSGLGESKENLAEGREENLKVKESVQEGLSQKMCTMLTCCRVMVQGSQFVDMFSPLNRRLHLLHEDEHC